ncbi:hypothetical protein Tco_0843749 [Tanacetum coccineum]
MNYLEEQTDGEAMINSIKNGEHPLHVVAQVPLTGTTSDVPPPLKDLKFSIAEEKKNRKIDRLARSLLIQGLPNDIYSFIDSNDTAKDLWDAIERRMRGSEYGEQDRKDTILYEYETFRATEGEQLLDTYLHYLQVINNLKKCGYKKDNCELNYKFLNNLQQNGIQLARKTIMMNKMLLAEGPSLDGSPRSFIFCEENTFAEALFIKLLILKVNLNRTSEYYDNSSNLWFICGQGCDQEIFHDVIESASENFNENHIVSQTDHDESEVDHNDSKEKDHLVDKLIKKFNQKIAKCEKRIEKANQQSIDLENQNKLLQNDDLLAQAEVLQEQLKVKQVVIDNHIECQAQYAKLEEERYQYMIRYSALCDNDKKHKLYASYDVNDLFVFDDIVQICLWIINSGCSKHMTGNRALLTNLVEKFLGTVHFGNNDFAVITGYGDVVIGSMTDQEVFWSKVSGLTLCSIGEFYLLTGDRSSNLYTIALNEIASNSLACLLAKAYSPILVVRIKVSHLNFATINNLVKSNLVRGLPKMKFEKDPYVFTACEPREGFIGSLFYIRRTINQERTYEILVNKRCFGGYELEECLSKKDSENEHLKSEVVDFTTVQNLQVQVEELKSVNESLNLSVEELSKARALAKATLRERDELISDQCKKMRFLEEQSEPFYEVKYEKYCALKEIESLKVEVKNLQIENKVLKSGESELSEKIGQMKSQKMIEMIEKEYESNVSKISITSSTLETKNLELVKEIEDKVKCFDEEKRVFENKISKLEKVLAQRVKDFDDVKKELSKRTDKFETYFANLEKENALLKS